MSNHFLLLFVVYHFVVFFYFVHFSVTVVRISSTKYCALAILFISILILFINKLLMALGV